MTVNIPTLIRRFERVFDKDQASVLAESITEAYTDLVKTRDFSELKESEKNLVEAQQRTETEVRNLVEAQQRTETEVRNLAEAQQRTDARLDKLVVTVEHLANNVNKLTKTVSNLAGEVGGLSRTMSYALENEAFRSLPVYLQKHFGIAIHSRFVRTDIGGEELDFFAQGERNGRPVCLVGEGKLRLDERRRSGQEFGYVMSQLDRKAAAVQKKYPDCEIVRMLVAHYVRPSIRELLEEEGVLVIQSFDLE